MGDEEYCDDEQVDFGNKKHNRRQKTLYEHITATGSMAGAVVAIVAMMGWALNLLPFAKAEDVRALTGRVGNVERDMGAIKNTQLQSLQLQLMDRLDKQEWQIHESKPENSYDLKALRNETRQRLDVITEQLKKQQGEPR